jgi:hypothetical protein
MQVIDGSIWTRKETHIIEIFLYFNAISQWGFYFFVQNLETKQLIAETCQTKSLAYCCDDYQMMYLDFYQQK